MDAMMLIPKKKNRKQRVLVPCKKKNNCEYLKEYEEELKKLGCEKMFVEECKKRGHDDMAIEELKKRGCEEMYVKELMKLRLKKKKKKKMMKKGPWQLKKEKIRELKVLNMDIDTLKLFFIPNDPRVPLASEELNILQQLDGATTDDILCEKLQHVNSATDKLENFIFDECRRSSFQFNTGYDIHIDNYVNINSLLFSCPSKDYLIRKNGRKVFAASLEGKYIMVCCCFLPICWKSVVWQALLACFEMYSKLNGDFEMVIVAKMRRGWTYDESAFNQFFDAFPSSCLAVPFHAQSRHHLICKSLRINKYAMNKNLLVDPNGRVLECKSPLSRYNFEFVPLYGSDPTPFPFLSRKFELVNQPLRMFDPIPTDAWKKLTTPTFLEDLLCCNTTDFVFRKVSLGNGAFSEVKVSISELKSKFSGLYIYNTGRVLPLLRDIMEASRQSNKDELEIIVVYIPTDCNHDLRLYPEFFSRALAKRNISWWVAPFNNTATIMLTHFFSEEDKVIIVGPNGLSADPRGAELMQIYGMYAYPFTFDCVVQKTVKELRQVTLENFIKFLEIQGYPPLNGKKVLFYFDWPERVFTEIYSACEHFSRCEDVCIIKVSFRSEEILKQKVKRNGLKDPDDKTFELNWHTESADKSSVFFHRFFNRSFRIIVAFGKKGKICSVCADRLSSSSSAGAKAKIKGNLFEEVSSILNRDVRLYNIDELSNFNEDAMQEMQKLRETMLW